MDPSAICFVCQKGRLEDQAVLLAASLRRHFPPAARLLAAHPKRHGALRRETESALDQLAVEVITIENPLRTGYPIGHKLAALALLQGTPLGVFLDSDILAMTPPGNLPEIPLLHPSADGRHHHREVSPCCGAGVAPRPAPLFLSA